MAPEDMGEEGFVEGRDVRKETGELVTVVIVVGELECAEVMMRGMGHYRKYCVVYISFLGCRCWVLFVELCNEVGCGNVGCRYPHVVGVWIAGPLDEIL